MTNCNNSSGCCGGRQHPILVLVFLSVISDAFKAFKAFKTFDFGTSLEGFFSLLYSLNFNLKHT